MPEIVSVSARPHLCMVLKSLVLALLQVHEVFWVLRLVVLDEDQLRIGRLVLIPDQDLCLLELRPLRVLLTVHLVVLLDVHSVLIYLL